MIGCPASSGDPGLAFRIYDLAGCRARALGENGFQALAGGSMFAQFLSGVMIVSVALIGLHFVAGGRPSTRNGVLWVARIGIVLALTGSWQAFDSVFARVVFDAPGQIAAVILPAAGSDDPGGLVARVQADYDAIRMAARAAAAPAEPAGPAAGMAPADPVATPAVPPVGDERSFLRPLAFEGAALVFVASGLGGLLAAQLAAGLLLAVGPLFVASMLLDATRGLFEGWVRALTLAFLGSIASMASLSIELDLLAAELARSRAPASGADPAALLMIVAIFILVGATAWWLCAIAAGRIRLPVASRGDPVVNLSNRASRPDAATVDPVRVPAAGRGSPRAAAMAEAIVRRERDADPVGMAASRNATSGGAVSARTAGPAGSPVPAVASGAASRRTGWQASASARRRDVAG